MNLFELNMAIETGIYPESPMTTTPTQSSPAIGDARVPDGWQLVPKEPTNDMLKACKGALYRHITTLPDADRYADRKKRGGLRVDQKTKVIVRWQAMLSAAPAPTPSPASGERDASIETRAESIMDTQIDPDGLSLNDILNDDQAALFHLVLVETISAALSTTAARGK